MTGAFKVELLDSRVAAFQFVLYEDAASAAQPNTNIYGLNFELSNGHLYALGDLFSTGSNYLATLSAQSVALLTAQLSAQGVPSSQLANDPGLAPAPANFSAFSITQSGLVIEFSQGQVIGTALGALTVTIPYPPLATLMNPKGPLVDP